MNKIQKLLETKYTYSVDFAWNSGTGSDQTEKMIIQVPYSLDDEPEKVKQDARKRAMVISRGKDVKNLEFEFIRKD